MNIWPLVRISEVCELIVDCVNKTAPLAAGPTPFKMIRTTNVRNGFIDTENVRYVIEPVFRKWTRRALPVQGDVVLTREAPLGEVGIIRYPDSVFLGQRTIMYRADRSRLDPYFLMYSMLSEYVQGQIRSYGSGSTVEHMRVPDCFNLLLPLPSLDVQRKISGILSTFDNLIENNNRRIKVLEEMARRIYYEWFVEFRYPGHASAPLADTELGHSPKGWDILPLSSLVSTQYGYTETASSEPIGPQFLRGTDINKTSYVDWSTVPFCRISESELPKYRLLPGDVVVIRMADPGKVGIVESDVDAVFASYLIRLEPIERRLMPYFLFYLLSSDRYQALVTGASTGTTRKSLSAPVMTSMRVAAPPVELQAAFTEVVTPLRRLLTTLLQANANLRSTRNVLLPRLVAGEIDVTDLDIAMPPAAA